MALPAAVAAHKLGRSVRCMLDRDEDMVLTGNRHPFYAKYKVRYGQCRPNCAQEGISDQEFEKDQLSI